MTDPGRIVAIVPAYNEAGAIGEVVDSIGVASAAFDVVVIDDGSHDDTAVIARRHGAAVDGQGVGVVVGPQLPDAR